MDKQTLRSKQKALLSSLDRNVYEHKSYMIANKLFNMEEWKNSSAIAVTVSNSPEVDTWNIIKRGWEEGKRVAVPKCVPKEKRLEFYYLKSFDELEMVYFGLFEPDPSKTTPAKKEEISLVIVPGLAFMRTGHRLGFGGGYYDRFLENFQGSTVALAFGEQIVEEVPIESFDLPVEKIISEGEIIHCE
ncbi:5-formyltetrahydrofolate cyclo-ligase [Bacillus sp. AK031]